MHFIEQGTGRPIVFLHGFGSSCRAFQYRMFPYVPQNEFRSIAPDFFGFGDSPSLPFQEKYTLKLNADKVIQLMDNLDIPEAFFVGTSLGGSIALICATSYPSRIKALAIQGAPYWGAKIPQCHRFLLGASLMLSFPLLFIDEFTMNRDIRVFLTRKFYSTFHRDFQILAQQEDLAKIAEDDVRKFHPRAAIEIMLEIFNLDLRQRLGNLTQPVLLIDGDRIRYKPLDTTGPIASLLPQMPVIKRIPGDHLAPWVHPELFVSEILKFFRKFA